MKKEYVYIYNMHNIYIYRAPHINTLNMIFNMVSDSGYLFYYKIIHQCF